MFIRTIKGDHIKSSVDKSTEPSLNFFNKRKFLIKY